MNPRDAEWAQSFSMESAASGVLQSVSPWSTATFPIRLAAAVAAARKLGLRHPMVMTAAIAVARTVSVLTVIPTQVAVVWWPTSIARRTP